MDLSIFEQSIQEELSNQDPIFDMTGRSLIQNSLAEHKFHTYFGMVDNRLDTTRQAIERQLDKRIRHLDKKHVQS